LKKDKPAAAVQQLPSRAGHEPQQVLIAHNTHGKLSLETAAAVQEAGMVQSPVTKQF